MEKFILKKSITFSQCEELLINMGFNLDYYEKGTPYINVNDKVVFGYYFINNKKEKITLFINNKELYIRKSNSNIDINKLTYLLIVFEFLEG